MQFDSITAFLHMGGHGAYVWAAYGVTFTVLLGGVLATRRRLKVICQRIDRQIRREESST